MRLFHEQGYHATGISTILREADVNSGSLYHYFPSKEALLTGVLEMYVEGLEPQVMASAHAGSADPIERIFVLLGQYRGWMLQLDYRMGCPVGNLALEVGDDHEEARKLIDLNFRNWYAWIERWVEEAKDRLPSSVNGKQVAQLVLTVMEGGLMQSRAAKSPEAFDACVTQLRVYIDLLLDQAKREKKL